MLRRGNDQVLNVKSKQGQILRIVRERYLRTDITCKISGCSNCKDDKPRLTPIVPHVVVPDVDTMVDYLEVFEAVPIQGLIVAQTILEVIQDQKRAFNRRALIRRLRAVADDGRRFSMVFCNENYVAMRLPDEHKLSLKSRADLAIVAMAQWFTQHITQYKPLSVPVIFLSSNEEVKAKAVEMGVQVKTMEEYMISYWTQPDPTFLELFYSVKLVVEERIAQQQAQEEYERQKREAILNGQSFGDENAQNNVGCDGSRSTEDNVLHSLYSVDFWNEYVEYLSEEVLDAGVKSGLFFKGKLKVNDVMRSEAVVTLSTGGATSILVNSSASSAKTTSQDRDNQGKANLNNSESATAKAEEERERLTALFTNIQDATHPSGGGFTASYVFNVPNPSQYGPHRLLLEPGTPIFIAAPSLRNRAIDGDVVYVVLLSPDLVRARFPRLREHPGPFGRVVGIETTNWRKYVCTLVSNDVAAPETASTGSTVPSGTSSMLAVPWDPKIPKIRIRTRQLAELANCRILVAIDKWDVNSFNPDGHYVKNLGRIGVHETEMQVLLHEGQVDTTPFSPALLGELPKHAPPAQPWIPTLDDPKLGPRRDITDWRIYSIDPPNCQDIDDALSCRRLPNGNLQIGVHIADVSALVPEGSLIDLEALARATSVYLADRRIDMLPSLLSERLCSLRCGEPRYAVSVIWEMDMHGNIIDTWYGRTMIKTIYEMCYSDAQDILDGKPAARRKFPDFALLRGELLDLQHIFHILRDYRAEKGALELESVEVNFKLDENKHPLVMATKDALEVHALVAEFMIFANCAVGEFIARHNPPSALLRRHPLPREERFKELVELVESRGCSIDTSSNYALSQSLQKAAALGDLMVTFMLRLTTLAMTEAMYISSGSYDVRDYYHYGLAADYYTHFTSPIRRYADLIVHRQLLAILDQNRRLEASKAALKSFPAKRPIASPSASQTAPSYANTLMTMPQVDLSLHVQTNAQVQAIAEHLNYKNRQAKIVQRNSRELYQTLFFSLYHDHAKIEEGIVASLRHNGLYIYLPKFGYHCVLKLRSLASANPNATSAFSLRAFPCFYDGVALDNVDADSKATLVSYEIVDNRSVMLLHTSLGSYPIKLFDRIALRLVVESNNTHMADVMPVIECFEIEPEELVRAAREYEEAIKAPVVATEAFTLENVAKDYQDDVWFASELSRQGGAPRNDSEVANLKDAPSCGICNMLILPPMKFGLLTHCDHTYCLTCIRKLRYSPAHQLQLLVPCPQCDALSTAIIPSSVYARAEARYDIGMYYKEHLQAIHCPYFQRGLGLCPYSGTCQFLHIREHEIRKGTTRRVPNPFYLRHSTSEVYHGAPTEEFLRGSGGHGCTGLSHSQSLVPGESDLSRSVDEFAAYAEASSSAPPPHSAQSPAPAPTTSTPTPTTSTPSATPQFIANAEKEAQKKAILAKLGELPRELLDAASKPANPLYDTYQADPRTEQQPIVDLQRAFAAFVLSHRGLRSDFYPENPTSSSGQVVPSQQRKPIFVAQRRAINGGRRIFKEADYRKSLAKKLEEEDYDYDEYEEDAPASSNPSIPGYSYGPSKSFGSTVTTDQERKYNLGAAASLAEKEFKMAQSQVNKAKYESRHY